MDYFTLPRSVFLYVLLFLGLTFPYWGEGQVIAPNRQLTEVGLKPIIEANQTQRPYYSDVPNTFIPALTEHLRGPKSGWLALWSNDNEMGHPLYHLAGFSPAYAPSWVISQFTDDPWRFFTALSLLLCFFSGLFVILLCSELGLTPLAGLIAGTTLAASPPFMANLAYPMFLAAWCWTAGILWALTRLSRKPDLLSWSMLTFGIYSMLITAVPQLIVHNAYIVVAFGVYLTYHKLRLERGEAFRYVVLSASAVIVGALLTLPIYMDIASTYADSSRLTRPETWFLFGMPDLFPLQKSLHNLAISVMPEEIFISRVEWSYPFGNVGLRLTPLIFFFWITGLILAFKRTWGWWLAIAIIYLFTFVHPLFFFAVRHLGFDLDRNSPLGCALLPITLVVAYGADALERQATRRGRSLASIASLAGVVGLLVYGVVFGTTHGIEIDWYVVSLIALLLTMLSLPFGRLRPLLSVIALILGMMISSEPLMLHVDPASIALTSPLIKTMRGSLPPGSRYAFDGWNAGILPPNINADLGIPSIHSYDSLSPRRYQTLIDSLGGEVMQRGRWNIGISPDFDSSMFWMSDIELILSLSPLTSGNLDYIGKESGVHVYRVISHMGDSLQVDRSAVTADGVGVRIADPRLVQAHAPTKTDDEGDRLEYRVTTGVPSVLLLSQMFHPGWRATVLEKSSWVPAQTTEINGVFQGVFLPQDASQVRLQFLPFVRYAWIGNVFWLLMTLVLITRFAIRFR